MAADQKDMSLEEMIADCAARGELVHLSVSASPSGKGFSASYGAASGFGIMIIHDKDPVKCLRDAIIATKLRRRAATDGAPNETNAATA